MYRLTNKRWDVTEAIVVDKNSITLELKNGRKEAWGMPIEELVGYCCGENVQIETDSGTIVKKAKVVDFEN
jgi:hypothetical protein